jgi:hypothetical protein
MSKSNDCTCNKLPGDEYYCLIHGGANGAHTCDELAQTDKLFALLFAKIVAVRKLIQADIEKRRVSALNVAGQIDCPICGGGKVNYSYAGSVNGHIHAQCTTENCVEWME